MKPSSRLAAALHDEELGLTSKLSERRQAADQAKSEAGRQVHEKESPNWNKALADYRAKVASYDFAGTLQAVTSPQLTDPELKDAQIAAMKKANWLAEWKTQLITDIRAHPLPRALTDTSGNAYKGIASADADHLGLILQYGATVVP